MSSFTGGPSSVTNSDRLVLVFTHNGVTFPPVSGNGSVCHSLPGLTPGDTLNVTDTTTGQTFTLTWQGRPSFDTGVCPGSKVVTGTLDTPQGSPVVQPTQIFYADAYRPGTSVFKNATVSQSGGAYTATFTSALAAGDHVQAADSWRAVVNGNDVSFEADNEAVVPTSCASGGGGGTSSGGGTTGTTGGTTVINQPTATLNVTALDLRHGLADLFKGGLLVSLSVNCPAGHTCVVTVILVQPGHVPAQAAAHKHKKKRKPRKSFVLARGTVDVTGSGTVTVKVLPTAAGKAKLKHKRSANLVLVITTKDKNTGKSQTQDKAIKLYRNH